MEAKPLEKTKISIDIDIDGDKETFTPKNYIMIAIGEGADGEGIYFNAGGEFSPDMFQEMHLTFMKGIASLALQCLQKDIEKEEGKRKPHLKIVKPDIQ